MVASRRDQDDVVDRNHDNGDDREGNVQLVVAGLPSQSLPKDYAQTEQIDSFHCLELEECSRTNLHVEDINDIMTFE